MTDALRVMTFNLRVDTPNDGINQFIKRTDRVLEAIRAEAPDIIGFQEATDSMRDFLRKNLPEYAILGGGRTKCYDGEGIPVAYKEDMFELIEFQTKWLSDTPDVPGSRVQELDQSKYPRIYELVKLRRISDNKIIALVNTHTDHTGVQTRVWESERLIKVMKEISADAIILTGDMNERPDGEAIKMLTADPELKLIEASACVEGTFHNFGRRLPAWKIDYVFSTIPCMESHAVEDVPVNGVYISDHQPVVADLYFEENEA